MLGTLVLGWLGWYSCGNPRDYNFSHLSHPQGLDLPMDRKIAQWVEQPWTFRNPMIPRGPHTVLALYQYPILVKLEHVVLSVNFKVRSYLVGYLKWTSLNWRWPCSKVSRCFPFLLQESICGTRSMSLLTLMALDFAFEISGAKELELSEKYKEYTRIALQLGNRLSRP